MLENCFKVNEKPFGADQSEGGDCSGDECNCHVMFCEEG